MTDTPDRPGPADDFLVGGGEMGERIRAHDWAASALGRPTDWPQPLKTLVGVMLAAEQPMFVAWGREGVLLYNDGYARMLADRHPAALGRPFLDVWHEVRAELTPLVDRVRAGEPVHMDDIELYLDRPGRPREAHFAFSYTPVRDERGAVVGLFCPCTETTDQVLVARRRVAEADRQRLLLKQTPGFVAVLHGPDHVFEYVNDAYVEIAGPRDFVGRSVREVLPELEGQGFYELLDGVYASGEPFRARSMAVRLAGEVEDRYLDFVYQPIRDDGGEVTGIFVGGSEVTHQRRVEEALRAAASRESFLVEIGDLLLKASGPREAMLAAVERLGRHLGAQRAGYGEILDDDTTVLLGSCYAVGVARLEGAFALDGFGVESVASQRRGSTQCSDDVTLDPGQDAALWASIETRAFASVPLVREGRLVASLYVNFREPHHWTDDELRLLENVASRTWAAVERARAEAALQGSEEFNRRILASSADCIKVLDLEGGLEFMSDGGMCAMEVDDFRAVSGAPWPDFWAGEEHAKALAAVEEARRGGAARFQGRSVTRKGRQRWWDVAVTPINGADGRPEKLLSVSRDITSVRAEVARQRFRLELVDRLRAESDPRAIMATAVEALGRELRAARVGYGLVRDDLETVDLETEFVDGVGRLAGTYPLEAFGVGNVVNLRAGRTSVYPDVESDPGTAGIDLPAFGIAALIAVPLLRRGELRAALYVNHPTPREWDREEIGLVEEVAARVWDAVERARVQDELRALNADLEHRIAVAIAENEQTQAQLRQAQKMEAVGQLTGGIAHDFNNLLTGVIGSLDMMQRRIAKGEMDRIARYATTAMTGANRAAALTHRLLAFARRQPLDPKPVNANRLVSGMEELLRRTIGESIGLEIVTAGGLWQTLCDPHQLDSAILNLAINARDAMPEGGKLTIETCNAHLDNAYAARQRDVRPGQYICICVTDTGTGMSKETVEKAFEPFFTTKPIGQGTGLGLSMIYGFTRQSEGYARIYSELGQGTTVKLYLPRYYGEADHAEEHHGELTDAHRADAGEVVVVVEDETAVRDLVVDVLEELGYRAVEAADGPAGLKVLQSKMRVDLLVTDIGLPGLNGRQLAEAARQQRPGLKVLFMTGYAENATIANGFLEPGMHMITKPFAIEALATRIRDHGAGPPSGRLQKAVKRIVILISGRGSNMAAIVDACAAEAWAARVVAVIASRPDAAGLAVARARGIETDVVDPRGFAGREAFDAALADRIEAFAPDVVALAGFMRILGDGFVVRFAGRLVNVHPSLLPAFPGLHTHARAIEAGCKFAGATVHFVTPVVDAGPIIAQAAVPVRVGDTPAVLGDRVLAAEHRLYPRAVRWLVGDELALTAGVVRHVGGEAQSFFVGDDDGSSGAA